MLNNILKQLHWLWEQTNGYRSQIFLSSLLDFLSMAFSLAAIYFSKTAIDIATSAQSGSLWMSATIMVILILLSLFIGIYHPWISERTFMKIQIALQARLTRKALDASWREASAWHSGDLTNRLTVDSERCVNLAVYSIPSIAVTFIKLLASFTFLCYLDTRVALLVLLSTPFLLLSKLYYKKMRALSSERKETEGKIESVIQESLVNRFMVSALGILPHRQTLLYQEQEHGYRVGVNQVKFGIYSRGILRFVFTGGYFITFLMGLYYLSLGSITFGVMTAFIQLVNRVQGPTLSLISFVPALIRVQASVDRLMELDSVEGSVKRDSSCLQNTKALRVEHLYFRYDHKPVIENVSFLLSRGDSLAIVGPTGAGKTTLLKLVLGILTPVSGSVSLIGADGIPYDVQHCSLKNFAYVPQGNSMFSGSIRQNLACVGEHVTDDCLECAIHEACADFVFDLPHGLDTDLGEKGLGLSEGQLQRLAVARSLLTEASICIYDEVTSALDADTSLKLMTNLLNIGKDKILLFVTHDPVIAAGCTKKMEVSNC